MGNPAGDGRRVQDEAVLRKNPLREAARLAGETRFEDTKPCKNGHPPPYIRNTKSGQCVKCLNAYHLAAYHRNKNERPTVRRQRVPKPKDMEVSAYGIAVLENALTWLEAANRGDFENISTYPEDSLLTT